jgi:hypothetical protein
MSIRFLQTSRHLHSHSVGTSGSARHRHVSGCVHGGIIYTTHFEAITAEGIMLCLSGL